MECRVCGSLIRSYALTIDAPGLSSLSTPIDATTNVAVCEQCGHGQSPEPVELKSFYDTEYRISLQSDDFDQLYRMVDGKPEYRTERQLGVLLNLLEVKDGMKVLDYGAAKAQSTRRLIAARPNIVPHVFDVSGDYQEYWNQFLPHQQSAIYELPGKWRRKFDLITTYFVLEHVSSPNDHLNILRTMLADRGHIFIMVPNSLTNTGDLLVIDHVNHFTSASIIEACARSGLQVVATDEAGFQGALAIAATHAAEPQGPSREKIAAAVGALQEACSFWAGLETRLLAAIMDRPDGPIAVHGAGFYGAVIMQRLANTANVRFVLDSNPHLQGSEFFGRPVIAPSALPPEVSAVIVALNPIAARDIVGDGSIYGRPGVDVIFIDGS